jgi:hypothetical protein
MPIATIPEDFIARGILSECARNPEIERALSAHEIERALTLADSKRYNQIRKRSATTKSEREE